MSKLDLRQEVDRGAISILYVGADSGTSQQRCRALQRLGHRVSLLDPGQLISNNRILTSWIHHTGALGVDRLVRKRLLRQLGDSQHDLAWVDLGHLVNPDLVVDLRKRCGKVINYNVDDPFGARDGLRFRQYLRSLPNYDLVTVVRERNIAEAWSAGARDVLQVFRSADEVSHAPRDLSIEDLERWQSEVVFVGTWMPERGPFLARLVELGVPLAIHGDGWKEAKEWPALRPSWRGPGIRDDHNYAKAIQCAKVCLGLLSKGNRDLSTTRSFEIPYLASVFCAQRTSEHLALYKEDEEAVFWDSPEECAAKCQRLLNDEGWRNRLQKQGHLRCLRNGTVNERIAERILHRALQTPQTMLTCQGRI
jgi:spore maturation protein CgeB